MPIPIFRWKDLTKAGAVAGSLGGMAIALIVWFTTAKVYMGAITLATLSNLWVSFAGSATATIAGGVLSVGLSLWRPANFDWDKTKMMVGVKEEGAARQPPPASVSSVLLNGGEKDNEKDCAADAALEIASLGQDAATVTVDVLDIPALTRTFKNYTILFAILATIICFVRVSSAQTVSYQLNHSLAGYSRTAWGCTVHLLTQVLRGLCSRHVCKPRQC